MRIRAWSAVWAAGWVLGVAVEARGEPAQVAGSERRGTEVLVGATGQGAVPEGRADGPRIVSVDRSPEQSAASIHRMGGASVVSTGRSADTGASGTAARALWALCGVPGNSVAPLVAERGQPLHVLGGPRSELVLVWSDAGGTTLAWFDGRGALAGTTAGAQRALGALDPRRAPALRYGQEGTSVVVPIADGTRRIVDLATGVVGDVEQSSSERLRVAATARERRGDHAGAALSLEGALADDPTDPDAWRSLARALERSGDSVAARAALARGTEALHGGRLAPVSMDWRVVDPRARLAFDLVTRYERDGDTARALAALDDVERLYPCMDQATLHRASLVQASGGSGAADAVLRATIERLECARARAAAHLDAVAFHERNGALDQAHAHLVAVQELGEQREVVLRALARIDLARGEPALAEEALLQLRARWVEDHAALTDERRRAKSSERLARLDAEIADVRAAVRRQVELAAVGGRR